MIETPGGAEKLIPGASVMGLGGYTPLLRLDVDDPVFGTGNDDAGDPMPGIGWSAILPVGNGSAAVPPGRY